MPKEITRNEGAGPAAETRTWPSARSDVKNVADRSAMTGLLCERPPEEVLVERERAGVRIALLEVDVRGVQVGRGQNDAFQQRRLEVRNMAGKAPLDAVRVALAERLG